MSKPFSFLVCAFACSGSAYAAANTDWALYGNDYANLRHSELSQINHDTINKLKLAWEFHTGKIGAFQASPVVVDGVMYLSTAFNDVLALDAASGKQLWRYQHKLTTDKTCCGPANRGVAVADGAGGLLRFCARPGSSPRSAPTVSPDLLASKTEPDEASSGVAPPGAAVSLKRSSWASRPNCLTR